MNIKYILKGLIAVLLLSLAITSCENYNEPLMDSLGNTREFSPIDLKAFVRNQTSVELNWTVKEGQNNYIVEFSADDPTFATIYKTVEVSASQLPVTIQLEGETVYSIRVKAKSSEGLEDSKWSVTTATTLSEQIFLPIQDGDIQAKQATLRWPANSSVTQIVVNPGNITHAITASEKASGVAIVTGLTPETTYTATLLNGTKTRGTQTFKTAVDIGDGILIKPTDDLNEKITNAAAGAKLYLEPGDYAVYKGAITLTKPISIYGLRSYDKPKVYLNFNMADGATGLRLQDLDLSGVRNPVASLDVINITGALTAAAYGDILITGCNIHDFNRLVYAGQTGSANKINSFKVDNSILTNFATVSADFIDFRTFYIGTISLTNSTLNNCANARDFIRVDAAAGFTGTGLTTNVLIDKCTITNKSMTATNRILYVRFVSNSLTVTNTLFADTIAVYTNSTATTAPTFSNNNNFNSPNLKQTTGNNRPDATATTLDPQFVNAAGGNFKVQNQTLIDNKVGDPRWLQ